MIIVIDFDNTIAKETYPSIGYLFPLADEVIRRWFNEGHHIIINTCRTGRHEGAAVDFLLTKEIPFHYVNCNLPNAVEAYKMDCRKISGDLYIDDKQLNGLPLTPEGHVDWVEIDMSVRKHPKF